jgi:hypothetical protein
MMEIIDPSAPKTNDSIERIRNENQKERIAPYRPSIDKELANLFEKVVPEKNETPAVTLVDWSFLDRDDGQPGELPDWAKRQIKRLESLKDKDETSKEMVEEIIRMHQYTRNIEPPNVPKRYDPNAPPFDPSEIMGGMELGDDFDDGDEDDEP